MTTQEWIDEYVAEMTSLADIPEDFAHASAEVAYEASPEDHPREIARENLEDIFGSDGGAK